MESPSSRELWLGGSKGQFSMHSVWEASLHSKLNSGGRAPLSAQLEGLAQLRRLAPIRCLALKLEVSLLGLRKGVLGLELFV